MPPKHRPFGQRLQSLRQTRQLTQETLATQVQKSKATIVALERGQLKPSAQLVDTLAAFFGIDADELHHLAGTHSADPPDPQTLGGFLAIQRKQAGLTQHDLANALGLTAGHVNKIEHNQRGIKEVARLQDLATLLQCAVDELIVRAGLLDVPSPAEQAQPEGPPPRLADLAQQNPAFGLALREMRYFTDDQRQTVIDLVERIQKEQE